MNIKKAVRKITNKIFPCKWGRCKDKLFGCNCGTFIGLSAGTIGTMALMGGGAYLASRGGSDDGGDDYQWSMPPDPKFFAQPEYEEAVGARKKWWEELQEGYLPEDWGKIWELAKQKTSQYYWGGPEGGAGLAGKVKASAARRNVSESPALESGLGRMGMAEAGQLKDIDVSEITGRMGERQNWLGQISKLASMKQPGTWQGATGFAPGAAETPWGDLAGAVGGYAAQYAGQKGQQDWYENLLSKYMPAVAQAAI